MVPNFLTLPLFSEDKDFSFLNRTLVRWWRNGLNVLSKNNKNTFFPYGLCTMDGKGIFTKTKLRKKVSTILQWFCISLMVAIFADWLIGYIVSHPICHWSLAGSTLNRKRCTFFFLSHKNANRSRSICLIVVGWGRGSGVGARDLWITCLGIFIIGL